MDCGRLEKGRRIDDVWSVGPALFDPADACAFNCLIRSMSASCQVQRPPRVVLVEDPLWAYSVSSFSIQLSWSIRIPL